MYYCSLCKAFTVEEVIDNTNTSSLICRVCRKSYASDEGIVHLNPKTMNPFPTGEEPFINDKFSKFKDKKS